MQSVSVFTCPPAPCAVPPGCGCCSSVANVFPSAPPAPPLAAAAMLSSAHGPSSEPPSWPVTPRAHAPKPLIRPPGWHTVLRSRCSVPPLLHAGSSVMLAPPECVYNFVNVKQDQDTMCYYVHTKYDFFSEF